MIALTTLTVSLAMMVLDPQGGHRESLPRYQDSIVRPYTAPATRVPASSHRNWAKPGRWCGWYMRKKLGVADPKYNLARNWARWGQASSPQVGAVVVWRNHVGQIVGRNQKGQWLIESGNDGGKVRTRPWSNLHKVIAYRI